MFSYILLYGLFISIFQGSSAFAEEDCYTPPPSFKKEHVYRDVPFKNGELSTYEGHYAGILVGYGDISVLPPVFHNNEWLRVFEARTRTAEWYRAIFEAKDLARGWSRPQDFSVIKFKVEQDETSASISQFLQEKWLAFNHRTCNVRETIQKNAEPLRRESFQLTPGATSSLGAVFELRSRPLKVGTTERILVYSSGKNWWLEGYIQKRETLTTPAGTFDAVKIKLQTYVGKELQQKGDVYAWIADRHPHRPLIMVTGDIKIGKVQLTLHSFRPSSSEPEKQSATSKDQAL